MQLTFLGTGSSMGIPIIGCPCGVCTSSDPKNRRLRTSALLEVEGKHFLIDAGPDFREQALKHQITHLDGVIITHAHYDHIGGLDELRVYTFLQGHPLPCLVSRATLEVLKRRYAHLFEERDDEKSMTAQLAFKVLSDDPFQGLKLKTFTYMQGGVEVIGFRINDFAYVSDIAEVTDEIYNELKGVKTLVLSALRPEPSNLHLTLDEAIAAAQKIGAKTYLTHMAHEIGADVPLPQGIELAWDGLKINL